MNPVDQSILDFEKATQQIENDPRNKVAEYAEGDIVVVGPRNPLFCFHFYPEGHVVRVIRVSGVVGDRIEYQCIHEETDHTQLLCGSEIAGKFNG